MATKREVVAHTVAEIEAMMWKWAEGDLGRYAAVYVTLHSAIRHQFVPYQDGQRPMPAYLDIDGPYARPAWEDMARECGYLSGSERTLTLLCEGLAHGLITDDEGAVPAGLAFNPADLWRLDPSNASVVIEALQHYLLARRSGRVERTNQ